MVTLMRFNIFLIFICIFGYMAVKLYYYIKNENKVLFKYTINICFFMSILFIVSLTLFPVEFSKNGLFTFNLIPFKTILTILFNSNIIDILANIYGNIILFTPLGFFSYFVFKENKNKTLKLCLISTILVETIQIIMPGRLFDIDDIMLNFLGGFIGLILAIKFTNYVNRKEVRRI